MQTPFLGQILLVPYNFAPQGWALCNGQLLPINQNTALFSLLGTSFGGNGTSNFALPNFQSRTALGAGQASGLSGYVLGGEAGTESVTLVANQVGAHTHPAQAVGRAAADATTPVNNAWGNDSSSAGDNIYSDGGSNATMGTSAIQPGSPNQPHENRQPFLVMNYIIALQGIYPARP